MENNIWKEIYDFYYLANLFLLGNDVSQGHAILNRGDELLSRNLTNEVRIQTLFILASVSEKMAIKEELGFLDKIITLDLTNDSYLKAMLRKANYHMRNEETDQGYNLGRCLVDESINRNNEIYLMQGWEFLGKYYFENNRYEEAVEAYTEMRTLAQKIGKPGEIFRVQLKLGIIWNLMGNVGIALEYLLNASTFAHDNKMPIDCAIADSLRASIFSSIGCHNEASLLLKNCGKIFESL